MDDGRSTRAVEDNPAHLLKTVKGIVKLARRAQGRIDQAASLSS